MTYAIACFAIAFVMVLVNAMLMQEQEQAEATAAKDGIHYHITVKDFNTWCKEHPLYGDHDGDNPEMERFFKELDEFIDEIFPKTGEWEPKTIVTEDPQTWPDAVEVFENLLEDGIPNFYEGPEESDIVVSDIETDFNVPELFWAIGPISL